MAGRTVGRLRFISSSLPLNSERKLLLAAMDRSESPRQNLTEANVDTRLLKRASLSSLVMGFWGMTVFLALGPESFRILDFLENLGYARTYPAMFLYYTLCYTVLVAMMIPFSFIFAYYSYRAGRRLKIISLRLVGLSWLGLTAASIALIPFVYQDSLLMIAGYEDYIAHGILPDYFFDPLAVPSIHQWIIMLLVVAALVLAVGSVEMRVRSGLNGFVLSMILAIMSGILVTSLWTLTLSLLIFPFTLIVFGLELHVMATRGSRR